MINQGGTDACPSSPLEPRITAAPPARNSYQGNGVVLSRTGTALARIPNPAEIIFTQENWYSWQVAYNRPAQISTAPPLFRWWHLVDCRAQFAGAPKVMGDCVEQYNSRHFSGGNLSFVDGHAKFRRPDSMRSGEFGLSPDEPYRLDLTQAYCTAAGACGGTDYSPAF